MYASWTTFKTIPDKRAEAEKVADQLFAAVKGMKGFKNVIYFGDPENNEYGSFYVWETKEDLDAAYDTTLPKVQELVGPIAAQPPSRRIFEVYEPKI